MDATQPPTLPSIPGVFVASCRDTGSSWEFQIGFEQGAGIDTVYSLLRCLRRGHELCLDGAGQEESYLLVRSTGSRLEAKVAYHGCYGTWRLIDFNDAVEHLRPGLAHHGAVHLYSYGSYSIYKDQSIA